MDQRASDHAPVSADESGPDRRNFMKVAGVAGAFGAVAGSLHGKYGAAPLISGAQAQTSGAQTASGGERWWPSRWGAEDESGASNWITPEKVLDAAKWIRDGKTYKLGRVYEAGMPTFGTRNFTMRIPGGPTGGPFGKNKLFYNDDFVATEIGQVGTQFDGLGHIGIQLGKDGDKTEMRYYNGFTELQVGDANGLKKLGAEKLKPLFTRGHLVDVQAVRGAIWDAGEEIKVADLRAALQRQNIQESDIREGDAIFFNTGWGSLWMKNNTRFNNGEPGIGMEVAKWVIDKGLCLTGADSWATEVVPNPDKDLAFPVHGELITKHGILNHENLNFDELIAERKYQFVYIYCPSPIKGATGSHGSPIAVT